MKTVLIVNSDPDFISDLSNMIDWPRYDCELTGSCSDGHKAVEFIIRQMPDLVFIQLSLPGLSGLDVISKIYEHGLTTDFVITEEKGDFASAQAAMRMGIQEYLTYPVTADDLIRVIDRFSEDLNTPVSRDYENYLFSTRRLLRNSFMRNFVSAEDHQKYSIDALNRYYHFTFREGLFQVALIQLRNLPKAEESIFLPAVVEEFRARFDPICNEMIPFVQGASRLTLLFNYTPESGTREKMHEIKDVLKTFLEKHDCRYTSYSIGIGYPSDDVNDLISVLHSAERAAYCGILRESNQIYYFEKLKFDNITEEDVITPEFLSEIEIGIETMDFARYETALYNTFKLITPQTDPEVIVQICRRAILEVARSCGESETITREEIRKVLYRTMNASSLSVVISALVENARVKLETAQKEREFTRPVREATKFIKKNFSKNITLEDVADHVHLNASYLSMLFKKETGTNYIGFLTECRINEAKRLLKDSGLSVAEICYAVGYSDKKHFSRLFIKRVGVRPTAYRSLH